jgi:hypothetical protein
LALLAQHVIEAGKENMQKEPVHVKKLSNGCWHIKGSGVCDWSTVKQWPCHEDTIRECAGGEASEEFIRAAAQLAIDTANAQADE